MKQILPAVQVDFSGHESGDAREWVGDPLAREGAVWPNRERVDVIRARLGDEAVTLFALAQRFDGPLFLFADAPLLERAADCFAQTREAVLQQVVMGPALHGFDCEVFADAAGYEDKGDVEPCFAKEIQGFEAVE